MSNKYGPKIVTDGLVLCLDAAYKKSYPGSGTTWYDSSGYDNHVSLVNGPTFDSGNGGSIVFDGSNDYGKSTSTTILNPSSYTKIVAFKVNGSATNNLISGGSDSLHALYLAGGVTTFNAGHNGSWATLAYNAGNMTGKWKICAVTFNTVTGWILYLDGIQVATNSSTSTFSGNGKLRIASYNDAYVFNGNIAVASIYNRVLSASEIQQNYIVIKERFGI
jgi:hypothetical protein